MCEDHNVWGVSCVWWRVGVCDECKYTYTHGMLIIVFPACTVVEGGRGGMICIQSRADKPCRAIVVTSNWYKYKQQVSHEWYVA